MERAADLEGACEIGPELIQALLQLGTATVYEAAGRRGAMEAAIKPIAAWMRVAGPALTVQCPPADNLMIHLAVALARPGDVLVVDAGGHTEAGYWGEILTVAAQAQGIVGLVIDGAVRDVEGIEARGFPVFARGISMRSTNKSRPGQVNQPVRVGGVWVHPGDIVVGDRDGVVVVRQGEACRVRDAAMRRAELEQQILGRLARGELTIDILGLRERLGGLGLLGDG
jgi:4-hydroxy-4-methyl-2-oxoglutarate aldolase